MPTSRRRGFCPTHCPRPRRPASATIEGRGVAAAEAPPLLWTPLTPCLTKGKSTSTGHCGVFQFYILKSKQNGPTRATYSSLIRLLVDCKRVEEADNLLAKALAKCIFPDLGMFNTLIVGHCENANTERAVSLLKEMKRMKIAPDKVTYDTMMQSYCRVGKVEDAYSLLDVMSRRGIKPDCISYNILICGYSKRGDMKDVMRIRDEMLSLGLDLNRPTFNAIL